MRIIVQTGNAPRLTTAVSATLAANRNSLRAEGALYPLALGSLNHSRLQFATSRGEVTQWLGSQKISDSSMVDNLLAHVREEIAAEVRAVRPRLLIVGLPYVALEKDAVQIARLHQFLSEFSDDLNVIIQLSPYSIASTEFNSLQIQHGAVDLFDALPADETLNMWREIFGADGVIAHEVETLETALSALFGVCGVCGVDRFDQKAGLGTCYQATDFSRLQEVNRAVLDIGPISNALRDGIHTAVLENAPAEIDSILAGFRSQIDEELKLERIRGRVQKRINSENTPQPDEGLTEGGAKFLDENGKAQVDAVRAGPFRPRNNGVVNFNEAIIPPPLDISLDPNPSSTLIIACIKNEAPYILEWIAHHQGLGVDDFLIYSNDCSDGSTEILDRLGEMGIIHHENNDVWKGKSPQQSALNSALKHKAFRKAKWVAHIDIDEFINLRWGETGTLQELYAMMGDATNLAMTWRMFGHNGIQDFADQPVIKQFTGAIPAYCPKPHTAWGFKTLLRNDGQYGKLSCHRPNKLVVGREEGVKWLNGSLLPMGENVKTQGWRSSVSNIGYNAVQLNHYALRSADSFLVKRQRGRALHVDRSIGLNYWIRMDWNLHREMSIQRFLPRTMAGIAALMADPVLAKWHQKGVDWHRMKAEELKQTDEFRDLYEQATTIKLTDDERVAATLAADMET